MAEKKKLTLEPGKTYKGYGGVNEYGETFFKPQQVGSRPQNMSLIKETELFSLYESAQKIKISITIDKSLSNVDRIKHFMGAFQKACVELRNYKTN